MDAGTSLFSGKHDLSSSHESSTSNFYLGQAVQLQETLKALNETAQQLRTACQGLTHHFSSGKIATVNQEEDTGSYADTTVQLSPKPYYYLSSEHKAASSGVLESTRTVIEDCNAQMKQKYML